MLVTLPSCIVINPSVCAFVCPRAYLCNRWTGFMDDVMFGRNGRDAERWSDTCVYECLLFHGCTTHGTFPYSLMLAKSIVLLQVNSSQFLTPSRLKSIVSNFSFSASHFSTNKVTPSRLCPTSTWKTGGSGTKWKWKLWMRKLGVISQERLNIEVKLLLS